MTDLRGRSARHDDEPAAPTPDQDTCRALAADLRAAGFGADNLRATWGVPADEAVGRGLREPALRALGERTDPLATLGRLLVLGRTQPAVAVAAALPQAGIAGLERLGLASTEDGYVVPRAVIRPQAFVDRDGEGEWWLASDLDEVALGSTLPVGHVLGAGGASLFLAGLHIDSPTGRVLDLGTGCGVQAIRARRYASEVVATDISPRARQFAEINMVLNDVRSVSTREGNLFDPVRGERFDRIVSNPPFVITPRIDGVPAYEYRDAGLVGDALVESVVTGAGEHLEPGGVAVLLGNWETRGGQEGLERVRTWVDSSPVALDAWVVERDTLDPVQYAEFWIRDGGTLPGTPEYAEMVENWLEDFTRRAVTAVGLGFILLRRPADGAHPTLARYERLPQPLTREGTLGTHLTEALSAHDRLTGMDDDALAAAVLAVAPDVTEARHHMPGSPDPQVIELRQGSGFARTVTADTGLAALVGACDGELPVGPLIAAIAGLLEVDADELRAELLPRVRELLVDGFLTLRETDLP
ncbi:DUF7059 domain-containing protein [Georgenia deserti]|uniref:Methyltransferase n=1 Tax=Georgenia deserti TaxID=2093781 RepID=A0ABW4LBH6_9MICO